MLTVGNAAAEAARFVERIPSRPNGFGGPGIVVCAGGVEYLTCAWVLVRMLRHLGCSLPIEVWYLGESEGDPTWIELVERYDVRCINALDVAEAHPQQELVFADINAKPVCRMRRSSDESWSGQAIDKPREAYRLHPSQCI